MRVKRSLQHHCAKTVCHAKRNFHTEKTSKQLRKKLTYKLICFLNPVKYFLFFFEIVIYPTKTVDEYRGKHGLKRSELLASAAEQYMA